MENVKDTVQKVSEAVTGTSSEGLAHGHTTAESGAEPVSGVQGQGKLNSPYDQGNAAGE